jgi:dTDP-4-amino-4,6-dideoxygalactose transaminase
MMLHNPFKVVEMFEEAIADYAGAPYAVSVNSCTNAIFLCCKYLDVEEVCIPKKTYLSVPQSIIHSGGTVKFEDRDWAGVYQLKPYPLYDAAKRFTSDMYIPGNFMCLSFHIKKHLRIGKGGVILTDDKKAVDWFKRARYEGRNPVPYDEDDITMLGWNMYMEPQQAAYGLTLLQGMPKHNDDLEEDYRDLTTFSIFKDMK